MGERPATWEVILVSGGVIEVTDIYASRDQGTLSVWLHGRRMMDSASGRVTPPDLVLSPAAWIAYR